jgi:hypothetical protein
MGTSAWQAGQLIATRVPHMPQKAYRSGFSKPHLGQIMGLL